VIIRLATLGDAAAIARVHTETWRGTYRGQMPDSVLDGLDSMFSTKFWTEHLQAGDITTFLIEIKNDIAGFCCLMPSRDPDADKKIVGEIAAINISPRYWRQGAGRKLCERAMKEARTSGLTTLTLWVLETNHSAQRFYEAMGLSLDGGRKTIALGGADLPEVRYRCVLSGRETLLVGK